MMYFKIPFLDVPAFGSANEQATEDLRLLDGVVRRDKRESSLFVPAFASARMQAAEDLELLGRVIRRTLTAEVL